MSDKSGHWGRVYYDDPQFPLLDDVLLEALQEKALGYWAEDGILHIPFRTGGTAQHILGFLQAVCPDITITIVKTPYGPDVCIPLAEVAA